MQTNENEKDRVDRGYKALAAAIVYMALKDQSNGDDVTEFLSSHWCEALKYYAAGSKHKHFRLKT